ncbi:triphosphoribosyl-dephospho-CoA synthase [Methylocystis sp. SC2]|uniref:triphosphoribosyl-dephospho-CoA synthase n=1 Tax=Methylocystis sp. (strain SC2) TaxID=187303 RepID=UPI00027AE9F3|nr:triphosphoribosyl-dephospho-CoA synthase [Methylocystis sp. SC2]CCJ06806.1 Triphosphoribosyl-dephospho-CoA protein [Methylocystis sp. SC2]
MATFAADPQAIATAFVAACEAELQAPKPGNVHVFADGHGMTTADFLASAEAAAPFIGAERSSVGARIAGAIEATRARVGQNTNLGIVLLCAPLAQAATTAQSADLNQETGRVLQALDIDDADAAFRAIAHARPAGLGDAPQHDVHAPAQTTLLEAMRAAAGRDRIAWQYANGFADIFDLGLETLAEARARSADAALGTLAVYAAFLAAFPDSHIARKHGVAAAEAVRGEAALFEKSLKNAKGRAAAFELALDFDRALKQRGLNPGTSADLTVAVLFADYLGAILARPRKNG